MSKTTMFPHRINHKYTWASPCEKTYNQVIKVDKRRHSNIVMSGLLEEQKGFIWADLISKS